MKPQHFAAAIGGLLLLALVLLVTGRPMGKSADQAAQAPTVTVVGEGEVRTKPDLVAFTFGVANWTGGASAAEAEALNSASVRRLKEVLVSAGVEEGRIETLATSVSPSTRQDYAGKTYLTGFEAQTRINATLRSLAKAEAVVAAGLGNGATSLESTRYGLENPDDARQKATSAALENARTQAVAIAQSQGARLGSLRSVEVLLEEASPGDGGTASTIIYRVRVRATYSF